MKKEKFIFLDVDGVLNCFKTRNRCGVFLGVETAKILLLKEMVEKNDAIVVLSSTWKLGWSKLLSNCDESGVYLTRRLGKYGVTISDMTLDSGYDRGRGIISYLKQHPCKGYVVLDDEIFSDFEQCGILMHLIKTDFKTGLMPEHVKLADTVFKAPIIVPDDWNKKPE